MAAHRQGVAVLAGLAHAKDKPLVKRVAFDLDQASAAAARIIQRNDERVEPLITLGRLVPALTNLHAQEQRQLAKNRTRLVAQLTRAVDRQAAGTTASAVVVALTARTDAARTQLAQGTRRNVAGLNAKIANTEGELRAASLVSQMLDNGWAVVADQDGNPVVRPSTGDTINVQTIHDNFSATVTETNGAQP